MRLYQFFNGISKPAFYCKAANQNEALKIYHNKRKQEGKPHDWKTCRALLERSYKIPKI